MQNMDQQYRTHPRTGLSDYSHPGQPSYRGAMSRAASMSGGGDIDASDTMARIYREEWADYLGRFRPYDKKMVDLAMGDKDNEQAIARAKESTGLAFDSANASYGRDMSRMGLSESADERKYREGRTARNKTAATVNAGNQTRLHTQDRDLKLLGGNMAVGLRDMDSVGA